LTGLTKSQARENRDLRGRSRIASSGELKIDCRKAARRAQHRGRCKSKTAARQLRRRSRSGEPANQLSGRERVSIHTEGSRSSRIRFANVAAKNPPPCESKLSHVRFFTRPYPDTSGIIAPIGESCYEGAFNPLKSTTAAPSSPRLDCGGFIFTHPLMGEIQKIYKERIGNFSHFANSSFELRRGVACSRGLCVLALLP